jgi:signal peptidase I
MKKGWRDYLENILVAIFLALVVRTFLLTGYKVPTSSMAPTLIPGDFIFAYRLPFGLQVPLMENKLGGRSPRRGEVVVFRYPDQLRTSYVKRVIGLEGDRIQIENGELSINGKKAQYMPAEKGWLPAGMATLAKDAEAYREKTEYSEQIVLFQKGFQRKNFGPIVVPPGEIFLLGDHRDVSDDSRYWGTVPLDKVDGHIWMVWMSIDSRKLSGVSSGFKIRWDRLMKVVH